MGSFNSNLRSIPSVERLLNDLGIQPLPRLLVTQIAREFVAEIRKEGSVPEYSITLRRLKERVWRRSLTRLQSVINATGIPLHTNLGRSPLSSAAVDEISAVASGYCNLEFKIGEGARGKRGEYVEECLGAMVGSPAVAIVNNCAAALFLILSQVVREGRPEVIISRGELVQIGGGFRIPDILASSGAVMKEVGTTNRTTIEDYESAVNARTGVILVVHRSNFYMKGFVEVPELKALVELGKRLEVPLCYDQGSGAFIDPGYLPGVENERTVKELLSQGIDLVCFSGDKLLGGPQAGIVCGRLDLIQRLKTNPMFRALRCDKLILSALQAVAEAYLNGKGEGNASIEASLPIYQSLSATVESLRKRGESLVARVDAQALQLEVVGTESEVGGGTLPQSRLPSVAITVRCDSLSVQKLARQMREGRPSIIGYIASGLCYLDLRTVGLEQDAAILESLRGLDSELSTMREAK